MTAALFKFLAALVVAGVAYAGALAYNEHYRAQGRAEVQAQWDAAEARRTAQEQRLAAEREQAERHKDRSCNASTSKRRPNVSKASRIFKAALLILSSATAACSTPSRHVTPPVMRSVQPARAPLPSPKLMQQPRPETYLQRAQQDTASWRQTLRGSPAR